MGLDYIRAVGQNTAFSPSEKLVLLCLGDHANEDGLCWPSIEAIRAWTSLKPHTIYGVLKRMEAAGCLTITRKHRRQNRYQLSLAKIEVFLCAQKGIQTLCAPNDSAERGIQQYAETGIQCVPKGAYNSMPKPAYGTPSKPPVNPGPVNPGPGTGGSRGGEISPDIPLTVTDIPPSKKRKSPKFIPAGPPALTPEETAKLIVKFCPPLTEERIREELETALSHQAARKYSAWYAYCRNWIQRTLDRAGPQSSASSANGTGPPKYPSPPYYADLHTRRLEGERAAAAKSGARPVRTI